MRRTVLPLLLLLGACATPPAVPPPAPLLPPVLPAVAEQGPALRTALEADPAWAPLIAAARDGSPDLETAAARVLQARAGADLARAAAAPDVGAAVSAQRTRQSLDQFGFDVPGGAIERNRTTIAPSIEAAWELDLFGRLAAERRAARARLDAATADAEAIGLSLETEVARRLVQLRTLDARLAATRQAFDAARALDRLARVRAEAGLVSGLDPATTAADVAQVQSLLPQLEAQRTARVAALGRLTGLASVRVEEIVATPTALPAAWAVPDIPSTLLDRRPDIRAAQARLAAADADVAAALAARFPRLTLTGSLGWLSATIAGLLTGDAFTASAGGALSGPLLDFGRTAARIAGRRGAAAEATAAYRTAVLDALAEVESALAEARGARAQALDLARAAAALQTAARLADVQYRGGLTDARTVSEAQRRLAEQRDRQIAAEGQAIDAALALELATGGPITAPGARV